MSVRSGVRTEPKEILGLNRITKKRIRELCRKDKLYQTPSLNDVLYLHYQGFQSIECLEDYTELKCLWLECNALSEIQGLENQHRLKCLFLQSNIIKKIENLEFCKELDTINLSQNQIRKLENINSDILPVLNTLNISSNYIRDSEDLKELENCKNLSVVDLSNNRIDDILVVKIFSKMPELKVLILQGNPVVTKIPQYRKTLILECKKLTYLDSRPVFPKDRACAEAWKRGGYQEERKENERWNRKERRKIRDSVNATIRMRNRNRKPEDHLTLLVSSDSEDEAAAAERRRLHQGLDAGVCMEMGMWDEVAESASSSELNVSSSTSVISTTDSNADVSNGGSSKEDGDRERSVKLIEDEKKKSNICLENLESLTFESVEHMSMGEIMKVVEQEKRKDSKEIEICTDASESKKIENLHLGSGEGQEVPGMPVKVLTSMQEEDMVINQPNELEDIIQNVGEDKELDKENENCSDDDEESKKSFDHTIEAIHHVTMNNLSGSVNSRDERRVFLQIETTDENYEAVNEMEKAMDTMITQEDRERESIRALNALAAQKIFNSTEGQAECDDGEQEFSQVNEEVKKSFEQLSSNMDIAMSQFQKEQEERRLVFDALFTQKTAETQDSSSSAAESDEASMSKDANDKDNLSIDRLVNQWDRLTKLKKGGKRRELKSSKFVSFQDSNISKEFMKHSTISTIVESPIEDYAHDLDEASDFDSEATEDSLSLEEKEGSGRGMKEDNVAEIDSSKIKELKDFGAESTEDSLSLEEMEGSGRGTKEENENTQEAESDSSKIKEFNTSSTEEKVLASVQQREELANFSENINPLCTNDNDKEAIVKKDSGINEFLDNDHRGPKVSFLDKDQRDPKEDATTDIGEASSAETLKNEPHLDNPWPQSSSLDNQEPEVEQKLMTKPPTIQVSSIVDREISTLPNSQHEDPSDGTPSKIKSLTGLSNKALEAFEIETKRLKELLQKLEDENEEFYKILENKKNSDENNAKANAKEAEATNQGNKAQVENDDEAKAINQGNKVQAEDDKASPIESPDSVKEPPPENLADLLHVENVEEEDKRSIADICLQTLTEEFNKVLENKDNSQEHNTKEDDNEAGAIEQGNNLQLPESAEDGKDNPIENPDSVKKPSENLAEASSHEQVVEEDDHSIPDVCMQTLTDLVQSLELKNPKPLSFEFPENLESEEENSENNNKANNIKAPQEAHSLFKTIRDVIDSYDILFQSRPGTDKTSVFKELTSVHNLKHFNKDTLASLDAQLAEYKKENSNVVRGIVDRVYAKKDRYNDTIELIDDKLMVVNKDTGELSELPPSPYVADSDADYDTAESDGEHKAGGPSCSKLFPMNGKAKNQFTSVAVGAEDDEQPCCSSKNVADKFYSLSNSRADSGEEDNSPSCSKSRFYTIPKSEDVSGKEPESHVSVWPRKWGPFSLNDYKPPVIISGRTEALMHQALHGFRPYEESDGECEEHFYSLENQKEDNGYDRIDQKLFDTMNFDHLQNLSDQDESHIVQCARSYKELKEVLKAEKEEERHLTAEENKLMESMMESGYAREPKTQTNDLSDLTAIEDSQLRHLMERKRKKDDEEKHKEAETKNFKPQSEHITLLEYNPSAIREEDASGFVPLQVEHNEDDSGLVLEAECTEIYGNDVFSFVYIDDQQPLDNKNVDDAGCFSPAVLHNKELKDTLNQAEKEEREDEGEEKNEVEYNVDIGCAAKEAELMEVDKIMKSQNYNDNQDLENFQRNFQILQGSLDKLESISTYNESGREDGGLQQEEYAAISEKLVNLSELYVDIENSLTNLTDANISKCNHQLYGNNSQQDEKISLESNFSQAKENVEIVKGVTADYPKESHDRKMESDEEEIYLYGAIQNTCDLNSEELKKSGGVHSEAAKMPLVRNIEADDEELYLYGQIQNSDDLNSEELKKFSWAEDEAKKIEQENKIIESYLTIANSDSGNIISKQKVSTGAQDEAERIEQENKIIASYLTIANSDTGDIISEQKISTGAEEDQSKKLEKNKEILDSYRSVESTGGSDDSTSKQKISTATEEDQTKKIENVKKILDSYRPVKSTGGSGYILSEQKISTLTENQTTTVDDSGNIIFEQKNSKLTVKKTTTIHGLQSDTLEMPDCQINADEKPNDMKMENSKEIVDFYRPVSGTDSGDISTEDQTMKMENAKEILDSYRPVESNESGDIICEQKISKLSVEQTTPIGCLQSDSLAMPDRQINRDEKPNDTEMPPHDEKNALDILECNLEVLDCTEDHVIDSITVNAKIHYEN